MTRLSIRLLTCLLMLGVSSTHAAIEIKDNHPTGGDCATQAVAGNWNAGTKTCTLTKNLGDEIQILSDRIILDGGTFTLDGALPGGQVLPLAVRIEKRKRVTVRNLKVTNFKCGIRVKESSDSTIADNDISQIRDQTLAAVHLIDSLGVVVRDNTIHDNKAAGVDILRGGFNRVEKNTLKNNGHASIYIWSNDNRIADNEVSNGANVGVFRHGIRLRHAVSNVIWGNVIKDHKLGSGISLSHAVRLTGNRIMFNTIERNARHGIEATGPSKDNQIVCNDFRGHAPPPVFATDFGGGANGNVILWNNFFEQDSAQEAAAGVNTYSEQPPVGGNYWKVHPCQDLNNDRICDAPYVFAGDADQFPHLNPIRWRLNPQVCTRPAGPPPGAFPENEEAIEAIAWSTAIDDKQHIANRLLSDEFADANRARDIGYVMALYAENPEIQFGESPPLKGQRAVRNWYSKLFAIGGNVGALVVQRVLDEGGELRALGYFDSAPRAALARGDAAALNFPVRLLFDIRIARDRDDQMKIRSERWELGQP